MGFNGLISFSKQTGKIKRSTFCIHSGIDLSRDLTVTFEMWKLTFLWQLYVSVSVEFQESRFKMMLGWPSGPLFQPSVHFRCLLCAGVSGGVIGWVQLPIRPAVSTIRKVKRWSWLCVCTNAGVCNRERQVRPVRQCHGSKSLKLLVKVFPQAALPWTGELA